jgi:hypothetical protein
MNDHAGDAAPGVACRAPRAVDASRGGTDSHVAVTVEGAVELHDAEAGRPVVDPGCMARPVRHRARLAGTIIELVPKRVLSYGRGGVGGAHKPGVRGRDDLQ